MKLHSNGKLSDDERRLSNYFHNFINDITHIRTIKSAFDSGIYDSLYDNYYDPATDPIEIKQRRRKSREVQRKGTSDQEADSGTGSQADASDAGEASLLSPRQLGVSTLEIICGDEHEKLSVIVHELIDIKCRWQNLLSEKEINLDDFDPDSEHELHHLAPYGSYEPVLRLLSDIFTKCYKCIELSKQWLNLAPKVYPSLPLSRSSTLSSNSTAKTAVSRSVPSSAKPRSSRPQTSKPGSSRPRLVIKKPRVAKFKPGQTDKPSANGLPTDDSDLSLDLKVETYRSENSSRNASDRYGDVKGNTYRVGHSSGDSATVLSGSFTSDAKTPPPSPKAADVKEGNYNYLMVQLRETIRNIDDLEISLQNYRLEIDALYTHEDRINNLEYKYNSVSHQFESLTRNQESDQAKLNDMEEKLSFALSGTSKFLDYQRGIVDLKTRIQKRANEMKMLKFQISVLEQDYQLEEDIKPNFENFVEDLKIDIIETERLLQEEKTEKLRLETEMASLNPKGSSSRFYDSVAYGREFTSDSQTSGFNGFSDTQSDLDYEILKSGSHATLSDRFEAVSLSSQQKQPESTLAWDR
ncbi:uncharacterized protein LOC126832644 [Patella vulgata]|uniref:uncharacterized protein LOC126832644 n=1 Tax=Patella vulgata TaxID=6465 RepID=UPI00217FCB43|nr:uncharacterized protein LOC126832644 [Patella vulgata]